MPPIVKYYKSGVLAMFYSQSEKYEIQTDEFEGTVKISNAHYREHGRYLNVSFGFRACSNGDWAIAAYAPDLANASDDERRLWMGFEIHEAGDILTPIADGRFQQWFERYIMGDFDVEDGPIASLDRLVLQVNAVTMCVVNEPLFTSTNFRRLSFPSAENTHRYQDAHAELYKMIIDGLNKKAIDSLGNKLKIVIKSGDKKTVEALEMLFPSEQIHSVVRSALDKVSQQRRIASHKERPAAVSFRAFEEFGKDIRSLLGAIEILQDDLARRLNVNVVRCVERASAMQSLPVFDEKRPTQSNYGIFQAVKMQGKHVIRVRTGELVPKPGMPEVEAILLEFSDGSLMSIEAGAHIEHGSRDEPIGPEALRARF